MSILLLSGCMQQAPPPVRQCEQNRLFQIISNWQLTKDGTCSKFVIKRDATPLLLQQCSPPVDVRVGQCNAEGYAVELTVRRFLDNCECKESKSRRIVRCRCSPVHETKRCLTDEIQIREITSQELINGECHPRKLVKKTKLKCPPPLVYKSDCDSMTCQRRVTIVEHVPEQCICKRFARVAHETCCCKGQKTIRYEGCRYNALKTFVEESIEPKLTDGACVKRTRHRFEPVACARNPTTVRHQCRHVSTMESGLRQKITADPALIFRQVEQFWWQMDSCECRQMRRAHFEACGCDQSAVPAESQFVHRCNQQNGVLITYKQTLKLEVDGTRQSSDQTLMIPDLSHAKCRPEHTIVSARKIVCPEAKVFHTACETAADGREYRAVHLHRWNRQGCACQNLPPELVERQLCSCRPERVSKQCVTSRPGGPENRLLVKHIREEIVVTQDPSGKRIRLCKLAPIEEKVHLISCPRSQIKYSGCVNGLVHITLRLHLVTDCQCHTRIRRLVTKCSRLPVNPALVHGPVSSNKNMAVTSQAAKSPVKGHAQLVLPVYQIADCIDLLPVKQCTTLEHPPHQVCEKPGQIRDLLCRRTCKQCTTCPLDQTKFSVVLGQLTDACIVSDKRYERMFFIRALVKRGDLAACKLACAQTPECSSIDYYVPRDDQADRPKCILNRVDPPTLMKRLDPGTVRIGSTVQDLEGWNARKCILFRKTCATECPKPQTIDLSKCECHQFRPSYQVDPTEDQLKPVTHCAKQVRVRYFTQTSSGRCVAKEWIGMIPCVVGTSTVLDGPHVNCLDTKPPLWCQSVITQNPHLCRDISMK
ncbi:von Willebrand factor type A domain protein, partial [Opisthorchis viverrini]